MAEARLKTGPKGKLARADYVHIKRMFDDGCTDEQIASVFGVHRTTVGRLRHSLGEGEMPPPSPLRALIDLVAQDYGPCDNEHLDEFCAKRDAALAAWREKYGKARSEEH